MAIIDSTYYIFIEDCVFACASVRLSLCVYVRLCVCVCLFAGVRVYFIQIQSVRLIKLLRGVIG